MRKGTIPVRLHSKVISFTFANNQTEFVKLVEEKSCRLYSGRVCSNTKIKLNFSGQMPFIFHWGFLSSIPIIWNENRFAPMKMLYQKERLGRSPLFLTRQKNVESESFSSLGVLDGVGYFPMKRCENQVFVKWQWFYYRRHWFDVLKIRFELVTLVNNLSNKCSTLWL